MKLFQSLLYIIEGWLTIYKEKHLFSNSVQYSPKKRKEGKPQYNNHQCFLVFYLPIVDACVCPGTSVFCLLVFTINRMEPQIRASIYLLVSE